MELALSAAVVLICVSTAALLPKRTRSFAAALFLFALGAVLYSARYEVLSENDLRLIFEEKPALISLRGRLLETPAVREFPGRTNNVEWSYARIAVSEVLFERKWRSAQGVVASTTPGILPPEFFQRRRIEVTGVIERPKRAMAPGLFDFRRYLYNARVFYQLRCESTSEWTLTSFEPMPLAEKFQRWAHDQLARGLPGKDEPLEMVRAMALGTNQSLTGEIADVFMATGTLHIFAISGLHVACIAACLLVVLRVLGVSRERAALILIPLVWFYTLATGWQSSAVRSAFMSTFVFAGWAIRRPTELLNSTAGAALLILLFEPEQLFQASFQLSFAVVAAIALILGQSRESEPWPIRIQSKLLRYDPLLPPELRPKWKQMLEIPLGFVLGNFAISAAAWIGSNPLTAYYFNVVTPISLLANLIAVPLSSLSLAATLGSLLLPPIGPLFNYVSWATMWETIAAMRWLSHLSWGYFYVPKPNLWFFLAYFAIVALWVVPLLRTPQLRRYSCVIAVVASLAWLVSFVPSMRSTTITMLPARGSPVLVDAPGRSEDLLIDCSNPRAAEQLLKRFFHGQGFGAMRNILISQPNGDHVGGLPFLLDHFSPRAVFTGDIRGRSRVYRDALQKLEATPQLLKRIAAPEQLLNWTVLQPKIGQNFARADDNAFVLKSEINGWKILFLSGLGPLGRKALLERGRDLQSEILICGAPEVLEDPELLHVASPRLVVLGAIDQPFKRGRAQHLPKCLHESGALVAVSSNENAVTLTLTPRECRVETGGDGGFHVRK